MSPRSAAAEKPRRPDISPAAVEAREAAYLVGTYARAPFHPRRGEGAAIVDAHGRWYWDLFAGIAVNALGHGHPALVKALRAGARELWHVSNLYYHPAQGLLAERLVKAAGMSRAFFCNSGTEAIEAAIKFARLKSPGRARIVALDESFHGRTVGALSLTGHEAYRAPFLPLMPGAVFVRPNDATALRRAVTPDTSAVVLEPIMGEGGVIPLTPAFLRAARELTAAAGALLVLDEIQCGLGRTGALFAFTHAGITPDLVTLAKPLGGGLPLGAVLAGPALDGVVKPGHHGTTFGGNPLACRLGLALLDELERPGVLAGIARLGERLGGALCALAAKTPAIVEVRGKGLIWGIELDREAAPVARRLLAKGFVVGTARTNVIRLLPPYVVPWKALAAFMKALKTTLKEPVT